LFHSKNDGSFGDGSSGLASFSITLDADDGISVVQYNGNPSFGADQYDFGVKIQDRVFRDTSSWYHLVVAIDTTQGSGTTNEADRIKMYVNGTQQTVVAINDGSGSQDFADENQLLAINQDGEQRWGGTVADGTYAHVYLAETNVVDGLQLDASYFGETKNGVWVAKAPNVSEYGNHGYRLQYKETSVGSGSSSTIGADTSGKNNHFTSTNVVAQDCAIPDSPENNMCTLNPIGRRYGQSYVGTFSEGSLKVASGGNATNIFGTMAINQVASQGGVYFEVRMDSIDTSRTYFGVVGDSGINNNNGGYSNAGGYTFQIKALLQSSLFLYATTHTNGTSVDIRTGNTAYSNGDVAGIAILSDGKFFVHRNGTYVKNADGNTGNPSTGANELATLDLTEGDWMPYIGYSSSFSINFGQDGTFNGQETSGGNQDANGIGDFMFAVPTNCLALCTSNMAKPDIGPDSATQSSSHFESVTYTGNGSDGKTVAVSHQPDWVWIKNRDAADDHQLFDSTRGATKVLETNDTTAEATNDDTLTAFTSTGFTVGDDVTVNTNNEDYVAWCWKANGGTTTTNDASATSIGDVDSVIQANTTAGFSIVTYTGQNAATTIAHGLGKKPAMVIIKQRTDAGSEWIVGHRELASSDPFANNKFIKLQLTSAVFTNSLVFDSEPTTTAIQLTSGTASNLTAASKDFVMYAFAEIDGFSKFGSYTGNDSTDGPFVYTGFQPAFLMVKRTNTTGNWIIYDNVRNTFNDDVRAYLYANLNNADPADGKVDFLSNGFKQRSPSAYTDDNASGSNYIYMAFAEAPFKYSNGN
jgi:hypothetical protein